MDLKFLGKRLFHTLVMFLFVITFNFFLFRMMPGDPLAMVSREITSTQEGRAALEKLYGLDQPLFVQYVKYVKSMLTFQFGNSFQYKQPVAELLGEKIGNSLLLAGFAAPLGILMGVLGGVIAGSRRGKKSDMLLTTATMVIYAVPSFWLGMILLMVFGVKLDWLPINGMVSPGASFATGWAEFKDVVLHLLTPVSTFTLATFGGYLLIMRGSMIDVMTEDFVLTARAKGLTRRQVVQRHVVPNAMLPVSTVVVISLALMFTGAFSIEVLFSWPGMGRLMVEAVNRQDYPVMEATNFIIACAVVAANFLMDLIYPLLDPRVRLE